MISLKFSLPKRFPVFARLGNWFTHEAACWGWRMMMRALSIMTLVVFLGCSAHQYTATPEKPKSPEVSRLHQLDLKVGIERQKVEEQVAGLLSRPNQYSSYGNNLRGGVVLYSDGDWVLEVKYKAGAPAPWIETPDGTMQHLPPMDETVLEYTIKRIPNKEPEATL